MRLAFTVAPIAFGLDKFFNVLVDWPIYLAPWVNDIAPGSGQDFMYVVAPWRSSPASRCPQASLRGLRGGGLAGRIIVNLLSYSGYYDVALRDFGLLLGALTLARLASVYDPPFTSRHR